MVEYLRMKHNLITLSLLCLVVPTLTCAEVVVNVMDVGYGQAIHIQNGLDHYLIDVGPEETASRLLQHLADQSVTSINAIFLTNSNSENMGGLFKILEQLGAAHVFWNDQPPPDEDIVGKLEKAQLITEFHILKPGDNIPLGDSLSLKVLKKSTDNKESNPSLAYGITNGPVKLFIPGDIDFNEQETLLNLNKKWFKNVRFLVWPRHGDTLAREIKLALKQTKYCVVSVGVNKFNLPSPTIQNNAKGFCQDLLRTDNQGDLQFLVTTDVYLLKKGNLSLSK